MSLTIKAIEKHKISLRWTGDKVEATIKDGKFTYHSELSDSVAVAVGSVVGWKNKMEEKEKEVVGAGGE